MQHERRCVHFGSISVTLIRFTVGMQSEKQRYQFEKAFPANTPQNPTEPQQRTNILNNFIKEDINKFSDLSHCKCECRRTHRNTFEVDAQQRCCRAAEHQETFTKHSLTSFTKLPL